MIKLQKKYIGRKVILADGTRTVIAKMLATRFKLEDGTSLKPTELKELTSGTLKQIGDAPEKASAKPARNTRGSRKVKEEPAPRTRNTRGSRTKDDDEEKPSRASTRRGSEPSTRGRRPNIEVLDDYSSATRRACQNYLKNVAQAFEEMSDMADYSLGELRDLCNDYLADAGLGKKKKSRREEVEEDAPVKKSKKKSKMRGGDGITKKARAVLEEARKKTASLKKKTSSIKEVVERETVAFSQFDGRMVEQIKAAVLKRVGAVIRKQTGYDVSVAVSYSMYSDRRCTLQIGLMPTDATDKEMRSYAKDVNDLNEEESLPRGSDEFDDDLGEFEEVATATAEEEEIEDDVEEFDSESTIDVAAIVKGLSAQIERKDKRLPAFVEAWFNSEEVDDTFGDEVKIGTELINASGNVAVVCGLHEEKNRVVIYDTVEEKFTFAKLLAVAKMEFAADVAEVEEEEEFDESLDEVEEELENEESADLEEEEEEEFDD